MGKEPGPQLREIVEAKHLPREYGGELDWTFEDEPILDEATTQVIDEVPPGPMVFVDGVVLHANQLESNRVNN